jgi:hypothetical protein
LHCHMPEVPSDDPAAKDGLIRSHSFAASNNVLALFNRDYDHLDSIKAFLTRGIVQLRIAGARKSNKKNFRPTDSIELKAGDRVEFAIHVHNSGAGQRSLAIRTGDGCGWEPIFLNRADRSR